MRSFLILATLALATVGLRAAEPEYPKQGPDIYSPSADASTDITAALAQAKAGHRHVLLDFGANWCVWCHRLHHTLDTDAQVAAALSRDFVVVMVDVNTRHGVHRNADVNARYGNPVQHGLPVLVVLDADGKQLTTQDSGALEEGAGHSPAKILAFLAHWAPARR